MSNEEFEQVELVNNIFHKRGAKMISTWQRRYLKLCPTEYLHELAALYFDSDVELLESITLQIEERNTVDKIETSRNLKERGKVEPD